VCLEVSYAGVHCHKTFWWVPQVRGFTVSQVLADTPTVRAHSSSLVCDYYYFWIYYYLLHSQLWHLRSNTSCYDTPPSATVTAVRQYPCGVRPHYSQLGYVMCQPHHQQVTLMSSSVNQAAIGCGRRKMLTGGNSASSLVNVE